MPRKKTGSASTVSATKLQFGTILAFFSTTSLEIADFALDLITDAVKQRHNKGKAVVAGRAAKVTEAVNNATASALPSAASATVAATTAPGTARRKPGPPKGFKKGQKAGAGGAQGQPAAQAADGSAGTGSVGEIVDADALPPQEGTLDLDAANV